MTKVVQMPKVRLQNSEELDEMSLDDLITDVKNSTNTILYKNR